MKLVAMLRVKNQIFTINECLSKLSQLVDEIVIVDNGSTDGTLSAYTQFTKIKVIKKTTGYHEGRDKILALNLAKERRPDWILWTDADEIFETSTNRNTFESYMNNPSLQKVEFRMFNFWKCKTHYRTDGQWNRYTAFPQRHMWRNLSQAYFNNQKLHNGGIRGLTGPHLISPVRLKHYGYVLPQQITHKNATYNKMNNDPRFFKTLPMTEKGIKLRLWVEFKNTQINSIWQNYQNIYWKSLQVMNNLHRVLHPS